MGKGEDEDMASKTIERIEVEVPEDACVKIHEMITNPAEVNDYVKEFFEMYMKKDEDK